MKAVSTAEISLGSIKEGLFLTIDACKPDSLFDAKEDAINHNEARFQLVEGCFYDFQINDSNYILGDIGENIIQQHKRVTNLGKIAPNIFVGKLSIPVLEKESF
jgi:hypothetical protein